MYCNATLFVQNVEKLIFKVFESLGHWNTAVMVILALHLGPIWLVRTEHCLNTITLLYVTNTMIVAMMTVTPHHLMTMSMTTCQGVRVLPLQAEGKLPSLAAADLSLVQFVTINLFESKYWENAAFKIY